MTVALLCSHRSTPIDERGSVSRGQWARVVATRAAGNGARGGFNRRVHTEACGHERRTARDEVVQGDRESRRREGEGVVGPASFSAGGSRHPSSRAAIGCHCSQMCSATHRLRRPSASLHLSGGCCSGRRSVGSTPGTRWFDTGGPALELSPLIHQPTRPSVRTRRRVPSRLSTNRPC